MPRPALSAVVLSYFALTSIPVTIKSFEAKDVNISIIAGTMYRGRIETFINAPIDIKNRAANMSLKGIVIILATAALLLSATSTPARNAPMTTDMPKPLARNDNPKARLSIVIKSKA